ncbi:hypothetical protein J3L16_12230 [Alteromonas sp. 5E99-2]|uniref:hypothetical protein n=1 Tax=Alteromonas sp. 5E99-2 TaxID=2817683 RepID=UPI001A98AF32|nr:hypothetical protein [Alteromonas sp. 5E99-2]MBO1256451.1 hypothetical protein [Alteromonas sp. 5E99-2]
MKLITVSIVALLAGAAISFGTGHFEFWIILTVSLLPINLLHGFKRFKDFQNDKSKYEGWKLILYPPAIFFFLTLTHHIWV